MHHRSLSQRASPQTKIATVIGPTPEAASMPQAGGVDVDELAIASTNTSRPFSILVTSPPHPHPVHSVTPSARAPHDEETQRTMNEACKVRSHHLETRLQIHTYWDFD